MWSLILIDNTFNQTLPILLECIVQVCQVLICTLCFVLWRLKVSYVVHISNLRCLLNVHDHRLHLFICCACSILREKTKVFVGNCIFFRESKVFVSQRVADQRSQLRHFIVDLVYDINWQDCENDKLIVPGKFVQLCNQFLRPHLHPCNSQLITNSASHLKLWWVWRIVKHNLVRL